MNACFTTGLMQQFHRLFGVLVLSLFSLQVMAAISPVVVSVDHRVTATFSKPQFDARKGVYTTQVRIQNRSAASLLSPLRLTLEQFDGKNVKPLNAQGVGKDGQPYFEFALPKGVLAAGGVTEPVKVIFAVEKNKDIGAAKERVAINTRIPSSFVYHVSAGVELAPLEPRAEPYALTVDSGKVNVRFSVRLVGKTKSAETVYLRRNGDGKGIAMNDLGKEGDLVAKDGIYGVNVPVDTSKMKPDTCLSYEVLVNTGGAEIVSPQFNLCVSVFPVRVAASNKEKSVALPDGVIAVADEILITVVPNTKSDTIQRVAAEINAKVVGSIPTLRLYQLKLSAPVSASQLAELVAGLNARADVKAASINAIGRIASTPNDPAFNLPPGDANSQHGLKLVLGHNQATGANAWDANALGAGVTVTVIDTGLDRTHPDFGTPGNCQLATDAAIGVADTDCGGTNNDAVGHGTQVAGVVGAMTNNGLGVAGVAYGSKIYSIQVSADAVITFAEMTQGFTNAASYGLSSVINASFIGGPWGGLVDVTPLCAAVNSAVLNAGVPVAVVVNGAGNNSVNSFYYPARCNDSIRPEHAALTRKDLFITVANSASATDPLCGSVAVDHLCTDSNFGAWVDIVAPGSAIRTTAVGGSYASPSGTSLSSPLVAGAAAILKSCGMPLDQIELTLKNSANVTVTFPDASSAKRLDIHRALSYQAPTAIGPLSSSINEGNLAGATVASLTATDSDVCDKFTFALVAGAGSADNGSFTITGNQLTINGSADYETKQLYNIRVRVTDFGGLWFEQALTINVNNQNDSTPVITSNGGGATASISVPENTAAVTTAAATDADNLGSLIYTISGTDAVMFNINSGTGVLTFAVTPNFEAPGDMGANNIYNIVVQASDGTHADTQDITVTVTNVNEAPVANNDTLPASQNTPVTYAAAQLLGNDTDVDVGTTLTISSVTSGAGGTAVLNGDGTVSFTPNPGFTGPASFTYRATDGSLLTNVATVTVNVSAVPHAPVANNDTLLATEDIPVTYTAMQLLDNDTDADAGTLLSVSSVTSGAGGTAVLNGVGTVTFSPNTNFHGVANFTYTATDGGLTSNVATVTVNVAAVNDLPVGMPVIDPPDVSGNRNPGQVLTALTGGISDDDGVVPPFHYEWWRDTTAVGSDNEHYTLLNTDLGGRMRVCVSYTDGDLTLEDGPTLCSATDATAVGDPHIYTVDGLRYDFQGAGEFVALRGAGGMEIQLRMAPVSTAPPLPDEYTGLTSGASVNTAVAARVGTHRVTYQLDTSPNAAPNTFVLRVDGVPKTLPLPEGGIDLGDGGRVMSQPSGIQIDFPDQTTLMINNNWGTFYGASWLHINVFHTSAYEGIMGARSKGSWLPRLSDGSAFGAKPASLHDRYVQLYVKFADSWRVNNDTTLFYYDDGTSTATFTNRAWPTENGPYVVDNEPVAKPLDLKAAQLACRDVVGKNEMANCIFDVRVVGRADLAKGHLLNQKIRLGATNVIVRGPVKLNERGDLAITATVARHATVVPKVKGIRAVPAGAVQFMLGGKLLGKPVKLDEKGQAKLVVKQQILERFNVGKQAITARYLPTRDRGNVFLPSISRQLTREVVKFSPVVRDIR